MKGLVVFGALFVVVVHGLAEIGPKHTTTKDWYETATFYQIYPRSFADSNGDGIGDIKGIISKLGHLKDIGITGTWLSPIFKSPMADMGYDISDYYAIDELFGTMADMEELFAAAKQLDIKVILDFVPNHSSEECEWFQKSIARDPEYDDYYIWRDGIPQSNGQRPLVPNNWVSVFSGPAWTWVEERQQYYYHAFARQQPDLNYRNPKVVEEMKNVLRFWLRKGAAGFRVDAVNNLFEVEDLRDEPINPDVNDPQSPAYTLKHYTANLDEVYEMIYQWRAVLDEFDAADGGYTKIMMTEALANNSKTIEYYRSTDGTRLGSHMPFNFVLLFEVNEHSSADDFLNVISNRLSVIPDGFVTNWVMGNHDLPRVGSRYGSERIDALLMLVMTLPGIAVTYYGEEIGMVDNRDGITFEQTQDIQAIIAGEENYKWASRDPVRTPFQWDDSSSAGFSNGTQPWLPVHPNYVWLNLKNQASFKRSTYKYYKDLMKLRESHIIIDGSFEPKVLGGNVLSYVRTLEDHGSLVVLVNFANIEQTISVSDLTNVFADTTTLEIVVAGADSTYTAGDKVPKNEVTLRKHDAVVLMADSAAATYTFSVILLLAVVCRCMFV